LLAISSCSAATTHIINDTNNNDDIQKVIDEAASGDTIKFTNGTNNGQYNNIALVINKTLTITSDGDVVIKAINTNASIPRDVINNHSAKNVTVNYAAAFYFISGSSNSNINNLKLIGDTSNGYKYSTLIYVPILKNIDLTQVENLNISNNQLDDAYYGVFVDQGNNNPIVSNNIISNMKDMGILLFGAANGVISNNQVYNITRHGIDVRHMSGANAEIYNNTIDNANEGIYLMHSAGHKVYNNTITGTTLSSITIYGATNTQIYDNTIGGQVGIYLGGGYANVSLSDNNYTWKNPSSTPAFASNLVIGDTAYTGSPNGVFSDSSKVGANISIKSTIDKTSIVNGNTILYTIKITNSGLGSAANLSLKNIIPAGLTLDGYYYASTGSYSNGVWKISELGTGDAVLVLRLKAVTAKTYTPTLTAEYADNLGGDNKTGNSVKLVVTKDIKLTYTAKVTKAKVKKGKTTVIQVTIKNTGIDNSNGITVQNKLPSGLKLSKVSSKGVYKSGKWTVTVNKKGLITLSMTVKVNKKGTFKVPINVNNKKIKTIQIKGV